MSFCSKLVNTPNDTKLPFSLWKNADELITFDHVKTIFPNAVPIKSPSAPKILFGIHGFQIADVPFSINFSFENNILHSIAALPNKDESEELFNKLIEHLNLILDDSYHMLEDRSTSNIRVKNCYWSSEGTRIRLALTHFIVPGSIKCALFFEPQKTTVRKSGSGYRKIEIQVA